MVTIIRWVIILVPGMMMTMILKMNNSNRMMIMTMLRKMMMKIWTTIYALIMMITLIISLTIMIVVKVLIKKMTMLAMMKIRTHNIGYTYLHGKLRFVVHPVKMSKISSQMPNNY